MSSAEEKPSAEPEQQQQSSIETKQEEKKNTPPASNSATSGRQTPRGAKSSLAKTPGATQKPKEKTPAKEEKKEETEEEKAARLKREEEDNMLLRPWLSPVKQSILRHHEEESKKKGDAAAAPIAAQPRASSGDHHHHVQIKDEPEVFADQVFAQRAILLQKAKEKAEKEAAENNGLFRLPEEVIEIDDVCERLYAEAMAKKRLRAEHDANKARELEDEEAGFDEECTFHPEISEDAKKLKFESWADFMLYRDKRNDDSKRRWEKKKASVLKEAREKEVGEERKMAPLSEKLLAYKAKKGQPHKGPITDYDHYLGKFILKKTTPEKGLSAVETGDNSRALPDPRAQRDLTERLYEDAIARVAARQVVERARFAADRAKLFHPMTNERLIAKLKELNPDSENDSWFDDANVETRLLSQGESYRLRNERRRNQLEVDALKDCTFTPRTNPKSRQMLLNWAKRAEASGGDPSVLQSIMHRVDRNLANPDDPDYQPLNAGNGGKVYTTEADALAALEQQQQQQQQNDSQYSSNQQFNNNNDKSQQRASQPRKHIPDPEGFFEKVKMQQAARARAIVEKRRQQESFKEDGCTFRPAMAPLTVALAKIRDDKEFGSAAPDPRNTDRDREILMPPHLRAKTQDWGDTKGSPRKYPRGVLEGQMIYDSNGHIYTGAPAAGASSQQRSAPRFTPQNHNNNNNNNTSASRRHVPVVANGSSNLSSSRQQPQQQPNSSSSRYHNDPHQKNNNNSRGTTGRGNINTSRNNNNNAADTSEHFLEDLEHELQGVISNWQSTDGM